jgi:hypothetical protein
VTTDLNKAAMAKLSPSSLGLQGQERLIDPEIEEVLILRVISSWW